MAEFFTPFTLEDTQRQPDEMLFETTTTYPPQIYLIDACVIEHAQKLKKGLLNESWLLIKMAEFDTKALELTANATRRTYEGLQEKHPLYYQELAALSLVLPIEVQRLDNVMQYLAQKPSGITLVENPLQAA